MAVKIDVANYRIWEEERYGHQIEEDKKGRFRMNVFGEENTKDVYFDEESLEHLRVLIDRCLDDIQTRTKKKRVNVTKTS